MAATTASTISTPTMMPRRLGRVMVAPGLGPRNRERRSHGAGVRLREVTQVALAPGDAGAVEVLAKRHRVLPRRAEQVADLGDRRAAAGGESFADPAAHLGVGVGVQVDVAAERDQEALGDADVEQVLQARGVAAGLV